MSDQNPAFVLSWTIFHTIEETSPLFGKTQEAFARDDYQFILIVTGQDESLAQELGARKVYRYNSILWNRCYVDILSTEADGQVTLDYQNFQLSEPSDAPVH